MKANLPGMLILWIAAPLAWLILLLIAKKLIKKYKANPSYSEAELLIMLTVLLIAIVAAITI